MIRATQKYQAELNKATQDLHDKTALLEKSEKDAPALQREIADLQTQTAKKRELLTEALRNIQNLRPQIPRLTTEMKRIHQ